MQSVFQNASAHQGIDSRVQHYTNDLNKLTNIQPEQTVQQARLLIQRAEVHRQNQQWQRAWSDYQLALQLSNELGLDMDIWFYMARSRLQAGKPDESTELLEKILQINPEHKAARLNLARSRYQLKEYELAHNEMNLFIELLDRPTPDQYLERATMARKISVAGAPLALDGLEQAVKALGPIVTLVKPLIELYLQLGHEEKALKLISSMPQMIQNLPRWQMIKGDIYAIQLRKLDAQQQYKTALAQFNKMPTGRQKTEAMQQLKQLLITRLLY